MPFGFIWDYLVKTDWGELQHTSGGGKGGGDLPVEGCRVSEGRFENADTSLVEDDSEAFTVDTVVLY